MAEQLVLPHVSQKRVFQPELLIRAHGNWDDFDIESDQAEELEARDEYAMWEAARRKADGEALPCPRTRYAVTFERDDDAAERAERKEADSRVDNYREDYDDEANKKLRKDKSWREYRAWRLDKDEEDIRETAANNMPSDAGTISVRAYVAAGSGWKVAGTLTAQTDEDGRFVIGSAFVPLALLATCPGLGTGMYEAAATAACEYGSVLAGSGQRSAFSERFWKRQVLKGRALCVGDEASVYESPHADLRSALELGKINVPQYNNLVRGLPERPRNGYWKCETIPLRKCGKSPMTLRGPATQYKIESKPKVKPRYRIESSR